MNNTYYIRIWVKNVGIVSKFEYIVGDLQIDARKRFFDGGGID